MKIFLNRLHHDIRMNELKKENLLVNIRLSTCIHLHIYKYTHTHPHVSYSIQNAIESTANNCKWHDRDHVHSRLPVYTETVTVIISFKTGPRLRTTMFDKKVKNKTVDYVAKRILIL